MKGSFATALLVLTGASAQGVTSIISAPGSAPSGCAASQSGAFGIQVVQLPGAAALAKRQVSQIGDGQIQATSAVAAAPVSQIGDGQIQATSAAAVPVSQIGDGQIQATSAAPAAAPVSQIGDGQIQATSAAPAAVPVSQIGDGQIQATSAVAAAPAQVTVTVTKDNCVASPITQIGDGQIQAPMATPVSQISDGQIQATVPVPSGTAVQQIADGQLQASTTLQTTTRSAGMSVGTSAAGYAMLPGAAQACASAGTLEITLNNGILKDSQNRTGYIAANSQFQFDDPPQTGAIYTAGWSVCSNGTLALGGSTTFYQCLSGSFYNLYLDNVLGAQQCEEVQIDAIQLNAC